MQWQLIHDLLDKLDQALNSNSFWLELGIPDGKFNLEQVLLQHLKTGNFHFELVKQDIQRDWNHYSERIFPKNQDHPILLQRPGNTWNGNERLTTEEISIVKVEALLLDQLTGSGDFFSKSSLGQPLQPEEARDSLGRVLQMLTRLDPNWTAFLVQPDFLNQVDDYFSSGYIKLGYFESCGRDLALCFKVEHYLYVLLTNGYS